MKYLTIAEAASTLSFDEQHMYYLVRTGGCPSEKIFNRHVIPVEWVEQEKRRWEILQKKWMKASRFRRQNKLSTPEYNRMIRAKEIEVAKIGKHWFVKKRHGKRRER